jgi:hypothetical protein
MGVSPVHKMGVSRRRNATRPRPNPREVPCPLDLAANSLTAGSASQAGEQRYRPPVTASRTSHCPSLSTRSSHCRCRMPQPTHIIKSGDAAHRYIRTHGAKCKKKRNEPNFCWSTHKTAQSCTTATANYRANPKNGGIARAQMGVSRPPLTHYPSIPTV